MMNFDGLDQGMGEYAPALHGNLEPSREPSMDPRLNPGLLQGVELDPDGLPVAIPESVHMMEGMFSELHSVHAEVGVPVTATHFDLQEELLWMGNHRVRDKLLCAKIGSFHVISASHDTHYLRLSEMVPILAFSRFISK
jgi:hypothetical protein